MNLCVVWPGAELSNRWEMHTMVWNSTYSHASMRDCNVDRRSNPTYFRAKRFIRNSAQSVFLPLRSNSSNAWTIVGDVVFSTYGVKLHGRFVRTTMKNLARVVNLRAKLANSCLLPWKLLFLSPFFLSFVKKEKRKKERNGNEMLDYFWIALRGSF